MAAPGTATRVSRWSRLGLSFLFTALCLWWTFKDTQWEGMWASLASARWVMLLPYLVILTGIHLARTLRWGNLLAGLERVPFRQLNEASAIGNMMLIVLPLRLGEFARPVLIAKRSGIRRSAAMTSVVFERIVDGIVVAVLMRALIFFVPADAPDLGRIEVAADLMFAVFTAGLVFLLVARWKHDFVIGTLRATVGRVVPRLTDRVIHIVDGFVGALRQVPAAKDMALFFFWSAVYWLLNGWGIAVLASAFDCSAAVGQACEPLSLTLFQGFFVMCVLVVGTMIPLAPGSAGTSQLAMLIALGVFLPQTVVHTTGVAWANVQWLAIIGQQIAFGLFYLARSHLSFREIAGELRQTPQDAA